MNSIPADSSPSTPPAASPPNTQERRIVAVEAALRSLAQSGGGAQAAHLSRLVRDLIQECRKGQDVEIAAMKRAGAVAMQCARVLDAMEKRLESAAAGEQLSSLSQHFARELERLREVAYEQLSSALHRETEREKRRFPVVFLN